MVNKKFTTYLSEEDILWLKQTALAESTKRGYEVTAAQLLREMIQNKKKHS
jgi:hypothetical protein